METKLIYKQMAKIMKDISAIEKGRKNTQGSGYHFRGIDDVYNAIHPLLAEHEIFNAPEVLDVKREERQSKQGGVLIYTLLTVRYTFYATDGSGVSCVVVGEGFDSGDKSSNKAMSGAHKYAVLQTFFVPTQEEKDSEHHTPEVLPKQRPAQSSAPSHSNNVTDGASEAQRKMVWAKLKNELLLDDTQAKDFIIHHTGKESSKDLSRFDVQKLVKEIDKEKQHMQQEQTPQGEWGSG